MRPIFIVFVAIAVIAIDANYAPKQAGFWSADLVTDTSIGSTGNGLAEPGADKRAEAT